MEMKTTIEDMRDEQVGLAELTTDQLEQLLVRHEVAQAQSRAAQIEALAELDRRQIATADGCRTLAEWTASRLDVAPETASRLVQLARSRTVRPQVFARLMHGEWSFDRTVDSDRWVTAGADESQVISEGPGVDIAGLRTRVALTRRMTPADEQSVFDGRHVVFQPTLDRTRSRFWGEMPGADADLVVQHLDATADSFPPLPDGSRPARSQRLVDALIALTTGTTPTALNTSTAPSHAEADDADTHLPLTAGTLSVFVDEGAAHTSGGYLVGESVITQLLCDAHLEHTTLTADGTALETGGRNTVTARQRRRIAYRYKTCAADGCTTRHRLQVHHRTYRSHGGTNHDTNLVLLCWYHHHITIHRHGFEIDPTSPTHRLRFIRPEASGRPQRE